MKFRKPTARILFLLLLAIAFAGEKRVAAESHPAADIVIRNAQVLTVDSHFSRAAAIAVRDGRILAVGSDRAIKPFIGTNTRLIDGHGRTVLPGLIDSHVHSYRASVSEFNGPLPVIKSLVEAFQYIRKEARSRSPGTWITLQRVYPTRMKEGRLPTLAELDAAAPNNPVYWNCGPVSLVNSKAMEISGITANTPDPLPGEIVKDPRTGKPTGLLRNAAQLVKIYSPFRQPNAQEQREAVKHLYHLYNQQGITSIDERRTDFEAIDLFRDLEKTGELTVRINCTRLMEPVPKKLDAAIHQLDILTHGPEGKGEYGPTGVGDDWVRIGPFKVFLDGGVLIGTAYMREPWGVADT
ncbi:MAG TPA: amidohydrolase family protein, partial [Verrucomicrobiae bacterium]|nr:amidohydrolase family protein [Verrucomicrobiae bacterium]